ncbi:hypothetical protein VIGAN_06184300 [Vigna angularis var. angularis]|uniref:Uncharacterized protein n=1 Tax=Vigna angularis var. angularis TaxID=157739 RepID=A0A0S3SCH8_PHAAN|nr:hypothetical protein VIGAN_06184300 [Vigna angularis var. angularis]
MNIGVPSVPLRVSGREDSVDKNEGTDNLSTQSSAPVAAISNKVSTTSVPVVVRLLEHLRQSSATDSTSTLCYNVQQRPYQRHLAS